MKRNTKFKKVLSLTITTVLIMAMMPTTALAKEPAPESPPTPEAEQFSLTTGETYYFDLSGETLPGSINHGSVESSYTGLPDTTCHYVPFTFAGTLDAYMANAPALRKRASDNKHSLFISDYNITNNLTWNQLNDNSYISGKNYLNNYKLRSPSVGTPVNIQSQTNEWDSILKKGDWIKNWNKLYSVGQESVDGGIVRGFSGPNSYIQNPSDIALQG